MGVDINGTNSGFSGFFGFFRVFGVEEPYDSKYIAKLITTY